MALSNRAAIVLAAGMGTRMKSATPKVLHKVAGIPILAHVLAAARGAGASRIVVVTAPAQDDVRAYAKAQGAETAIQERQLGTGDAARAAASALADFNGVLIVTYGDHPLFLPETFAASFAAQEKTGMAIVAFESQGKAYGRVLTDADGLLDRIVEHKDASEAERKITLCNAGILAADARGFFRWAANLSNDNAQREYYLTDIPVLAKKDGVACAVVTADEAEMQGVNSRAELAAAEAAMQTRLRARALDAGVGMVAPETVFLSADTVLEEDVQIGPFVVFGPGVTVRKGAEIKSHSHLEGAVVEAGAIIGPFARLRPGAQIGAGAHIGNFVEIKKAVVEAGAKANHLSYIGDARVGAGANIGAGTITCNYDGFDKHFTDIGAGAFIGSNSALVAPVKIGDGAFVGAGSTIAKPVAGDALALTRAEQKVSPGWAKEFRTRKKAERAERSKK
jgi:bifunctional UDP-N-acetylglucosamine pyrophosphorylase/glucosamine-1-phosphate N-acetyltransferase